MASDPDDDFDALLAKSSLGGEAARRLRERTPLSRARTVRRIIELRNLVHASGAPESAVQAAHELLGLLEDMGYRTQGEVPEELRTTARLAENVGGTDVHGGNQPSGRRTVSGIVVVPPLVTGGERGGQIRLVPGERLRFGRSASANGLEIPHEGVSRTAGEITAWGAFWMLSNLSGHQTYVVENPEGVGEHIKVGPGRLDAPVPFEFSRIVLPAAGDLLPIEVWAPRHERLRSPENPDDECTVPAFSLDRTKRYFAVLAALCEPRLRGAPYAALPTVDQVVERLRPTWPAASRTSVQWNIDYLAVKLRLKPGPDTTDVGPRLNSKKEFLAFLALRFGLVAEDDLVVLAESAGPSAAVSDAHAVPGRDRETEPYRPRDTKTNGTPAEAPRARG